MILWVVVVFLLKISILVTKYGQTNMADLWHDCACFKQIVIVTTNINILTNKVHQIDTQSSFYNHIKKKVRFLFTTSKKRGTLNTHRGRDAWFLSFAQI